ncbi:hypothetical protein GGR95_001864 [Sulfitobacter undariae]|uniref:Asparagine synthase n=1 Tax=Sulfitobacter undariae TaxID=1563671 RepID=A0A7W6E3S8_9RHOB|nr:hypothetical protein [Sulfitobacter undariae]MBB3994223.1 hypothetical protein [Sulfitobacter undariae]
MIQIKAETDCVQTDVSFDVAFRWQYLLTQRDITQTALLRHTFAGWNAYVGDGVHITRLRDVNDKQIGLFIGIGVAQEGLIEGDHQINALDVSLPTFFIDFEDWLFYVAGRYNVLVARDEDTRFYSDAVGTNGTVFATAERQVASSLALCINRDIIDHPLYDHTHVENGSGNYSLFHTRDKDVRRANPNAYLSLSDFKETRFWPRDKPFATPRPRAEIYSEIITRTASVIDAINAVHKTALPLSGGQDSRLLAAIASDHLGDIEQKFTNIHCYSGRIDATVAGKVAQVLDIQHEIYDRRDYRSNPRTIARAQAEYDTALGYTSPIKNEVKQNIHRGVTDRAVVLRGHQTDLLRAVFVDRPGAKGRANLRWQIKRMSIVPHKEFNREVYTRFVPEYEAWIATLPRSVRDHQVDLMFVEIYNSSTIGASFPAISRNFFMSPFNSRHMITLSLSIEEQYRHDSLAVNDILMMLNPALHDLPFDYEFSGRSLDRIDDDAEMAEATQTRRDASRRRQKVMNDHPAISASDPLPDPAQTCPSSLASARPTSDV